MELTWTELRTESKATFSSLNTFFDGKKNSEGLTVMSSTQGHRRRAGGGGDRPRGRLEGCLYVGFTRILST